MSLYPVRDKLFATAIQKRVSNDSRKEIYGNHPDSLLVEHSYPELAPKPIQTMENNYKNRCTTPNCWQPINIKHFRVLKKIGSGTYGSVFHAQSPNSRSVAIKQLCPMQNDKHSQDGFHITAIREIKILKSLHHPNIISLHDVICCKENVMSEYHENTKKETKKGIDLDRMATYMIFEYMHHDLSGLLHNEAVSFDISHIKYFLCQILRALEYCHHTAMILHRDIKSSNLLVDDRGVVKIADFGLSRQFIPELKAKNKAIAHRHASVNTSNIIHPRHYTNRVVTLWYRAPELLLSDVHYTPAVDLWSVGCVFAELLFSKPIFTGKNELEQWLQIIEICGWNTNNEGSWIGTLRDKDGLIAKLKKKSKLFPRKLKQKFAKFTQNISSSSKYLDENGFELLDSLLTMNPSDRCSASDALNSEWFASEPFPEPPTFLGAIQPSHDYEQRQQRKNPNYKSQQMNQQNSSNSNMHASRRYQYNYSYNQNKITHHNNTNNMMNQSKVQRNDRNDRNRDRSRSRSRDRNDRNDKNDRNIMSRSDSFEQNKAGCSTSLPPPIQRLPSIHSQTVSSNKSPIKQVVTLAAPKLQSNSSNNHVNQNQYFNGGFKSGFNPDQPHTFYSRFKKPDELKGRSRF